MYTTSTAFLEALEEANVSYIFSNLGSDHPSIIESLAEAKQKGIKLPKVITCPNEMVALSAAHGYAIRTGKAQAVIVHVECGTQNLGGAVHNAAKGRVPVLIFAGASPYTQEDELTGSRNEYIQWIQDVHDQRGIIRGYTKYDNEIRTGKNVKQVVHRALQIAKSNPKGPVYLMGAREAMEEKAEPVSIDTSLWEPIAPNALAPTSVNHVIDSLVKAKSPLVVTSYLGRNPEATKELVKFCEALSIPVLESCPSYMNFPADHDLHCGYQWNTQEQNDMLANADTVLVMDSDLPWIPTKNKASDDATVFYFDVDPIKENMPLWYIPSKQFFEVDTLIALQQLNAALSVREDIDKNVVNERLEEVKAKHQSLINHFSKLEKPQDGVITPEYLTACLREIKDKDTIFVNESISNYETISNHLHVNEPHTLFGSGSGSLGWNGGAAIGMKLAAPDKTVISLTGDGSYFFSVPSTVHWMAKRYETPFLTVIFNNQGWKSPKLSTLGVHPEGIAKQNDDFHVSFDPVSDLGGIAKAAGGAFAKKIEKPEEVMPALKECLEKVRNGQTAVLDVQVPHV